MITRGKFENQLTTWLSRFGINIEQWMVVAVLASFSLLLVVEATYSVGWRMVHDTPLSHYYAFLISEHGYAPYRDMLDTSFPGTFLFHLLVVKLLGFSDSSFMALNFIWLIALSAVTWAFMKPLGWRVAWSGVVFFGIDYLREGPSIMMQRDYILILPISLAVLMFTSTRLNPVARPLIVGLCFGLAASIKPHAAIGLLWPVLLDCNAAGRSVNKIAKIIGLYALGFLIPMLSVLAWVWYTGSLTAFIEMSTKLMPLYLTFTGAFETISGWTRVRYSLGSYLQFGGHSLWFVAASFGTYFALFQSNLNQSARRLVYMLVGLAVLYSLYTVLAGRFVPDHWLPFNYFVILLSALCLVTPSPALHSKGARVFPIVVLLLTSLMILRPAKEFLLQVQGQSLNTPRLDRVDQIANYLKSRLRPGDTVQPLDVTSGAVHAMLIAKALPATPYVLDYYFYFHVSNPYVQQLRQRLITAFECTPPRFVIDMQDKVWPYGPDTTREFPQLRALLAAHYSTVLTGDGFSIYERRSAINTC